MKSHRTALSILTFFLVLVLALSAGCDTLGIGSSGGGDGGEAGDAEGGFEPIDLSGAADDVEENGEADDRDAYINCPGPEEAVDFELTLDYDFNVKEPNGYINEWTDNTEGVMLTVQGSTVTQASSQPIRGTITGEIGDCQMDGSTDLSLMVSGNCQYGVIHLTITSQYANYTRTMICNGMEVGTYTEPYLDAPSISADFIIISGGDTAGAPIDMGPITGNVIWRLTPMGPLPIPTP
jgi:hypothetical protein